MITYRITCHSGLTRTCGSGNVAENAFLFLPSLCVVVLCASLFGPSIGCLFVCVYLCVCLRWMWVSVCTFVPLPPGWPRPCEVTAERERSWLNETCIIQAFTVTLPRFICVCFFLYSCHFDAEWKNKKGNWEKQEIQTLAFTLCLLQHEVHQQITRQAARTCPHTEDVVKHLCCKFSVGVSGLGSAVV